MDCTYKLNRRVLCSVHRQMATVPVLVMLRLVHKSRVQLIYYAVFIGGMILLISYFWMLVLLTGISSSTASMLYASGVLLIITTFALAFMTTRAGRTLLTVVSGALTGTHGYLLINTYPVDMMGTTLFAWLMLGLLLSFAAFFWLRELRRRTV